MFLCPLWSSNLLTGFVHFFPFVYFNCANPSRNPINTIKLIPFVYFNCANPSRNPINTIKLNETFGFI